MDEETNLPISRDFLFFFGGVRVNKFGGSTVSMVYKIYNHPGIRTDYEIVYAGVILRRSLHAKSSQR